ncbi:NAD(P)H-hydrate dehydratase [Roseobacter ponti]|uniref:Bifunctional NAD(P)H-hydrate repair enzyme n=1 Tax=Roseobacter ponti TaxID=1891787 RepID=A0A858SRM7_9RHOB|nr:NAD(P)H-hydrate dehydratase [Roseobacter ponti]QJF51529.1 NAD(P)H-hydrate dehydratase [Roseobacter ponti]
MTELLTARQMRDLEQAAIAAGTVTGAGMMEKAGQGVVSEILKRWPELRIKPHRALVLCGPGNNGGDGFVIARLLIRAGWSADVFLSGDPEKLPPDARTNYDRLTTLTDVHAWDAETIRDGARPDVIIDAVFGAGLTRPLPRDIAQVLGARGCRRWKRSYEITRVAVDCPSGLNLDNGMLPFDGDPADEDFNPWPDFVNSADLTVTFHSPKAGHYLGMGPLICGRIAVVDIGLSGEAIERSMAGQPPDPERARLAEPRFAGRPVRRWPGMVLSKNSYAGHKYHHGHVIAFAGGVGRGGAGRLAARAALRIGAGLVTLVCPRAAVMENAMHLNSVMLRGLDDPKDLARVADERVTAFCVGPGLGTGARTRDLVAQVLARAESERDWRRPAVVLDADALTSFADDPGALFAMTHARTVLTPHEGEFGRLFPDLAQSARADASKIEVARLAAARAGCVVLLKGPDTVIAAPDGGATVHAATYNRQAPWLATAGAGDVLAGMIAGIAASPTAPDLIVCAEAATWLHTEAARAFGPGLIAEDLSEMLPQVLRAAQDQPE